MPLKRIKSSLGRLGTETLTRFFAWWRSELLAAWEDWSLRKGSAGQLTCDRADLVLSRLTATGVKVLARAGRPVALSELPAAIGGLLTGAEVPSKLEIVLPAEAVLRRTIRMPSAVEPRLRQAVSFQLERLMPLKSGLVYYTSQIVERQESGRRILVEVAESRRELADAALRVALAAGVRNVSITTRPGTAANPAARLLHRSAVQMRPSLPRAERWLAWGAATLVVLLLATVFARYHAENARLAANVEALKSRAAKAEHMRDALQDRIGRIQFLAYRANGLDAEAILAELTRLMPSDAWVFQYQAEGDRLQVAGFAKDASAVSSLLSKSGMFREVALRSAVKAPGAENERFDISIRLRGRERS